MEELKNNVIVSAFYFWVVTDWERVNGMITPLGEIRGMETRVGHV